MLKHSWGIIAFVAVLATQIGLELVHAPHRFVEPWPAASESSG